MSVGGRALMFVEHGKMSVRLMMMPMVVLILMRMVLLMLLMLGMVVWMTQWKMLSVMEMRLMMTSDSL